VELQKFLLSMYMEDINWNLDIFIKISLQYSVHLVCFGGSLGSYIAVGISLNISGYDVKW